MLPIGSLKQQEGKWRKHQDFMILRMNYALNQLVVRIPACKVEQVIYGVIRSFLNALRTCTFTCSRYHVSNFSKIFIMLLRF